MRGAARLLLPLVVLLLHAARGSAGSTGGGGNGSCTQSCGRMRVPYPFGFSRGCTVQLGCDDASGTAWLGGTRGLGLLVSNVTPRAIVLTLPPNCSRPLNESLDALFTDNYAPTAQNALVVSSCDPQAAARLSNCSIPPEAYLEKSCNSIRCVLPSTKANVDGTNVTDPFLNRSEMRRLGSDCRGLVSASIYSNTAGPALQLTALELDWWVQGRCGCSSHAICDGFTPPSTQKEAFRCECQEGFEGDGYTAGAGCRRGQYSVHWLDSIH
jgi:hypothetical protein